MDYIFEIENVLTPSFCKEIIERFENDKDKETGRSMSGFDPKVKVSTDLGIALPHKQKEWKDVLEKVCSVVLDALPEYASFLKMGGMDTNNIIDTTFDELTLAMPQIQKTSKNGFYTWHHDGLLNRVLTYIIYLNDVNPENGGSTDFLLGKSIQPKTGKMVIFPANFTYIHRGKELVGGVKYIMTNFIYQGPPIYTNPRSVST